MKHIIAIDIGNSYTKLAINGEYWIDCNNNDLMCQSALKDISCVNLAIFPIISVSNVADQKQIDRVIHIIQKKLDFKEYQLKVWTSLEILKYAGIKNATAISHFGTDRALKIYYLASLDIKGVKISIGCGTAFTIEVTDADMVIESMILPGFELQLNSLFDYTARLPWLNLNQAYDILNKENKLSTNYSIVNGILNSYLGIIKSLFEKYQPQLVICSGGYAELICKSFIDENNVLSLVANPELLALTDLGHRV